MSESKRREAAQAVAALINKQFGVGEEYGPTEPIATVRFNAPNGPQVAYVEADHGGVNMLDLTGYGHVAAQEMAAEYYAETGKPCASLTDRKGLDTLTKIAKQYGVFLECENVWCLGVWDA